jgi:hypothetical protein
MTSSQVCPSYKRQQKKIERKKKKIKNQNKFNAVRSSKRFMS